MVRGPNSAAPCGRRTSSGPPSHESNSDGQSPGTNHPRTPAVKRRTSASNGAPHKQSLQQTTAVARRPRQPAVDPKASAPRRNKGVNPAELPGTDEVPTGPGESWRQIATAHLHAFDASVPMYILDRNYYF